MAGGSEAAIGIPGMFIIKYRPFRDPRGPDAGFTFRYSVPSTGEERIDQKQAGSIPLELPLSTAGWEDFHKGPGKARESFTAAAEYSNLLTFSSDFSLSTGKSGARSANE
jgi:hypothetical protein